MLVKIISIMLRNTYTTDDLVERMSLMRTYYAKRLFTKGSEKVQPREVLDGLCEEYTLRALEHWQELFSEASVSDLAVYEALDAIEEEITGIPSLTLYVPIYFAPEYVEGFGKWLREQVQPNILMSIRTDPRMVGGCGFIWHGTFYDLSLRYYIERNRPKIVALFGQETHGG